MSNEREMLEFAAKACGIKQHPDGGCEHLFFIPGSYAVWNPKDNSADCAAMCAKLFIDSDWYADSIRTQNSTDFDTDHYEEWTYFKDHNNDREAAWRYAACKVAEAIGRAMK